MNCTGKEGEKVQKESRLLWAQYQTWRREAYMDSTMLGHGGIPSMTALRPGHYSIIMEVTFDRASTTRLVSAGVGFLAEAAYLPSLL